MRSVAACGESWAYASEDCQVVGRSSGAGIQETDIKGQFGLGWTRKTSSYWSPFNVIREGWAIFH